MTIVVSRLAKLYFLTALCGWLLPQSVLADSQLTYLDCLLTFEPYADANWHVATHSNAPPDSGYFGDGSGDTGGGIRSSLGTALAYAVLVQAFPNDTNRAERLNKVRQALNYAANTHVSGTNVCTDGTKWGHSWGSAYLSGHLGVTCLEVLTNLPAETIGLVQRAIADEATYRAGIPPASGWVSDTKAEENAWNSQVVTVAAAWMTNNTNAGLWLTSAKQYLVNTHTVADTNGDPLADWVTTITLYPDYALENHGFYHPGYKAAAGELIGDSLLTALMINPSLAAQLQPFAEHDVLPAWTNYSYLLLDSGEMNFPAGEDWDLNDYEQNAYLAWIAAHFNDPLARWADGQVAQLERYRQMVNGDGRFVGPSTSVVPPYERESIQAFRSALAWLHWTYADYPTGPTNGPAPFFLHMPDVGVMEQRGSNGYVSICYGPQTNGSPSRIMAVIEAPTTSFPNDVYTVAPRLPGILGLGAMGNPTSAKLINLTTNGNTFTAELQLVNGANGTTEAYVDCNGATIGLVEVPAPLPGVNNTAAGSFSVGIENAPLNGGSRLLEWNNGSSVVTNLSGTSLNISNNWLCVAGHYGMTCGPAGYFNYKAATAYGHGTAMDVMQFIPTNSLTPRYAVFFPGQNAAQTASNASNTTWTYNSTNWTLSYPGPGGSLRQIVVTHPPLAITQQPQSLAVTNGEPATYTVAATTFGGGATVSYQWQKNGTNISGATGSSYTIAAAGPSDVGTYQCVVSIPVATVTSAAATLRIIPNTTLPAVTSGTLWLHLTADKGLTTNSANGVTTWLDQSANAFQFNSQAALAPPVAGRGSPGNRVVHFTGTNGLLSSKPLQLFTSSNSPLTIFAAFSDQDNSTQRYLFNSTVVPRVGRQFTETMVGVDAGNDGAGNFGIHRAASLASFSPSGTIANSQFCAMTMIIESTGNAPSNVVIFQNGQSLPVGGPPPGTGSPDAPYTELGWLSAGHYPTGSYAFNLGVAQDSSNTNTYLGYWLGDIGEIIIYRGALSPNDRALVEGYLGGRYAVAIASIPALSITSQPHNLAVTNGQSAVFSVAAFAGSGETDFSYQWQKNGSNIGGATSSSFLMPAVGPSDVGGYQCVVSIPATNVTSAPATLRLIPPAALPVVSSGTLLLRLSADSGITTSQATNVTAWLDQSANAFHFNSQADLVSTFLPTLAIGSTGNQVVHFTGNNRLLSSGPVQLFTQSNSPLTIFTAFSVGDNSTQRYILNSTVPRTNRAFLELMMGVDAGNDGVGNYGIHRAASGATYAPAGTISNNQFYLMSLTVKSAGTAPNNMTIYGNGMSLPVSGTPASNPTAPYTEPGWLSAGHYPIGAYALNIGAVQDSGNTNSLFGFWTGDIAEIIVYQGALADTDRQAVQTYLGRKYGLFNAQLQISQTGNNVIISYPVLAGGYVLEQTPQLTPGSSWIPVNPQPVSVGNQFWFTNQAVGQQFYRLRLP